MNNNSSIKRCYKFMNNCKVIIILFALLVFVSSIDIYSQSATATYSLGDGSTDRNFTSLPGASSCPLSLTVNIPDGAEVLSVDVSYSMTAIGNAWISEQRSELRCVSPGGVNENILHPGLGNYTGTYDYQRTGLDIANNVVGGGDIVFELHAGRTFGGSGCGTSLNYVNNNSFTVTVHYTTISCEGVPNPGIINISQSLGCNDVEIDLLVNAIGFEEAQIGLSYQWQYSHDALNWFDIDNENNPTQLVYSATSTTFFRLQVSCSNSNEVVYSNIAEYITEDCDNILISEQGTTYTCNAMFYDSGGPFANYQNNEDYIKTICSSSGHNLRVEFLEYDTEDNGQFAANQVRYDILYVYDGDDTSNPMFEFAGIQTDINKVPIIISSQECITFRFVSNETNTRSGWEALITCTNEINTVASQFCSSAPTICNFDGYIGNTSNFYNIERNNGQIQDFGPLFEGALDNNSFIKFVAGYETVELEILVENCHNPQGGSPMVQFAVYSGTNCVMQSLVTDPFYTHFNSNAGLQQGQHLITLTGLSVGTTYYIMVDGHSGAICDYHISAQSGIDFAEVDVTNATICLNESITITASGGDSYVWNGPGVDNQTGESITVTPTTEGLNIYYVTITGGIPECPDEVVLSSFIYAENCCEPGSVEPPINPNNPEICEGETIPQLTVDLPLGYSSPEYQINWYQEATGGTPILSNSNSFTPNISSVAGTYTYYAAVLEVAHNCFSDRIPVVLTINESVNSEFDLLNVYCLNDDVNLPTISNNGISGTWNPAMVNTNSPSSPQNFIFTPAPNQGCAVPYEIMIEIVDSLTPTFSFNSHYCVGDLVELPTLSENNINGTWTPSSVNTTTPGVFTYIFTPSGNLDCINDYHLTIEIVENQPLIFDDFGPYCQFETPDQLPSISNNGYFGTWTPETIDTESPGTFDFYFTPELEGCFSDLSIEITVHQNPTINVTIGQNILCYGETGIINVSASGGTPPYSGLGDFEFHHGTYSFEITDNNSCSDSGSITLSQPPLLTASVTNVNNQVCETLGNIEVQVNGGVPPYSYFWQEGHSPTNTSSNNLPVGEYTITVTDLNNCEVTVFAEIGYEGGVSSEIEILKHVECYGESTGEILVHLFDGTPEYNLYWGSGSTTSNSTFIVLSNLQAGEYTVTVVDSDGCMYINPKIQILEPAETDYYYIKQEPSCIGNYDGFIEFFVYGGTEPYEYNFNGFSSTIGLFEELYDGTYYIAVNDANNCKIAMEEIILNENPVSCLIIPNAITPNGDGINDQWIIENIELFPDAIIHVYNRWGQIIYFARGNDEPWDGKYKGKFVPTGTYLYTIKDRTGDIFTTGTLTVVY